MPTKFLRGTVPACLSALLCVAPAVAADYPERPIRVVVPYAAAGTMDIAARILFERVARSIGQPAPIRQPAGRWRQHRDGASREIRA